MTSVAISPGYGLEAGTPALRSVGRITFGPDDILFVADNLSATIFALEIVDHTPDQGPVNVEKLETRLAAFLGCTRDDVFVRDMAVHPVSQAVYLSVMRGSGDDGLPALIRLAHDGTLSLVNLEGVRFSQTAIDDAPAADDARQEVSVVLGTREGEELTMRNGFKIRIARDPLRSVTVTDMSYVDGMLLVAGASNEEFSSALRRIPFPFEGGKQANSLEIYHVSHGKYETASPIRSFVPYGGNSSILASYTCTPVVHFSLSDIASGTQVKGRTVAELGSGNTPLDMVSYAEGGAEYLLVSNSRHPLMKINCADIPGAGSLTEQSGPAGVPRLDLPLKGVSRMANLGADHVLMMQLDEAGDTDLRSYSCASL